MPPLSFRENISIRKILELKVRLVKRTFLGLLELDTFGLEFKWCGVTLSNLKKKKYKEITVAIGVYYHQC